MTSGAQCNIQNSSDFSYSYSFGGETYTDLVAAYSRGGIGSRPGDSGGPVFTLDGEKVTAKGTISGGSSYYPIKISYNGKCLDADANALNRNGTRIQLWDCNNTMQQNFVFTNDGSIRSATNQPTVWTPTSARSPTTARTSSSGSATARTSRSGSSTARWRARSARPTTTGAWTRT